MACVFLRALGSGFVYNWVVVGGVVQAGVGATFGRYLPPPPIPRVWVGELGEEVYVWGRGGGGKAGAGAADDSLGCEVIELPGQGRGSPCF